MVVKLLKRLFVQFVAESIKVKCSRAPTGMIITRNLIQIKSARNCWLCIWWHEVIRVAIASLIYSIYRNGQRFQWLWKILLLRFLALTRDQINQVILNHPDRKPSLVAKRSQNLRDFMNICRFLLVSFGTHKKIWPAIYLSSKVKNRVKLCENYYYYFIS